MAAESFVVVQLEVRDAEWDLAHRAAKGGMTMAIIIPAALPIATDWVVYLRDQLQ